MTHKTNSSRIDLGYQNERLCDDLLRLQDHPTRQVMPRIGGPDRTGKLFDDEGDLGAIGHLTRLLSDRHTTHQFFFKRGANPTA